MLIFILLEVIVDIIFDSLWTGNSADYWAKDGGINSRHIYTFENTCNEVPGLRLGDDTVKIVLNTKGTADDVSDDVKELLHYIGGDEPKSDLTRSLDDEVEAVKTNEEWRREYMTLLMRDNENKALGEQRKVVSVARTGILDNETMSKAFQMDVDDILLIQSLIKEHPEMDDEEIAEIYIDIQE